MVHPIPRTRSVRSFLAELVTWYAVTVGAASLLSWLVINTLGFSGWREVLLCPLAIGVGMVSAAVSQVAATRSQGLSGILDVRQSVTLTVPPPASAAVQSFREALRLIGATEVDYVGEKHIEIHAKTRGNEIHFSCHPNQDGSLEVHIRSGPRSRWGFVDGGTNLANVRRLAGAFWWGEMRQRYAS